MLKDKSLKRQIGLAVAGGAAFIVLLGIIKYLMIISAMAAGAAHKPPPDAVSSLVVKRIEWEESIDLVGSLAPVRGTMLSAEEPGKVVKVNFDSGALVKEGDLLVEIDTSVEEANLKSAVANSVLAKQNLDRIKQLIQTKAASKADLDAAEASYRAKEAEAASIRAIIARKRIIAPFAGRTGIRNVNVGQYVRIGDPVVPLQDLTKLFVNFTVPQSQMEYVAVGNTIELSDPTKKATKSLGIVSAVNPQIEVSTRNLSVQGVVENQAEILKPGMFIRVRLVLPQRRNVIAVPTSAVNYAPYGDSVYVIENKDGGSTVRQQIVKLGLKREENIEIASGLNEGDEIVVTGVFKLRPGSVVNVVANAPTRSIVSTELSDT